MSGQSLAFYPIPPAVHNSVKTDALQLVSNAVVYYIVLLIFTIVSVSQKVISFFFQPPPFLLGDFSAAELSRVSALGYAIEDINLFKFGSISNRNINHYLRLFESRASFCYIDTLVVCSPDEPRSGLYFPPSVTIITPMPSIASSWMKSGYTVHIIKHPDVRDISNAGRYHRPTVIFFDLPPAVKDYIGISRAIDFDIGNPNFCCRLIEILLKECEKLGYELIVKTKRSRSWHNASDPYFSFLNQLDTNRLCKVVWGGGVMELLKENSVILGALPTSVPAVASLVGLKSYFFYPEDLVRGKEIWSEFCGIEVCRSLFALKDAFNETK